MRLPALLRKRLSCHGMTYGLQLITATTGVLLSTAVMAASATQHFAIAAGPLDKALSPVAARANVILSFSPSKPRV